MAKLGPHPSSTSTLSNLEPFRYGAQRFIEMYASLRDQLGASGLHLYPSPTGTGLTHPDIANPPLKQWERDWIWFSTGALRVESPTCPKPSRAYWVGRLADFYGCDTNAAGKILDTYNDAGEVAPMLIPPFRDHRRQSANPLSGHDAGSTGQPTTLQCRPRFCGNRSLPGERLDEYVTKARKRSSSVSGETPVSVISGAAAFIMNADKTSNLSPRQ